eukprot:TRINITY_DN2723_c0_g3_i1.p1 TRINITY_DN2723_c0_g3~~TRINITY_DN2723_c0_g3_i1.p1  ORF type:complete len:125 (+),score=10.55 TRINITY_DN2723_c0_g3_i1:870-1244(+)
MSKQVTPSSELMPHRHDSEAYNEDVPVIQPQQSFEPVSRSWTTSTPPSTGHSADNRQVGSGQRIKKSMRVRDNAPEPLTPATSHQSFPPATVPSTRASLPLPPSNASYSFIILVSSDDEGGSSH